MIVAGAGTGKTRTLTSRVVHLLETGVAAERVLLLTFTRRAAEDMLARVATLVPRPEVARRVWGGTFHAVAHRVIAEHASLLGLERMSVLDPGDVVDLVGMLREDHGLTARDTAARAPRASTIADVGSRAVNTGRPVRDVIAADAPWCQPHTDAVLAVLRDYTARKRARGLLDFDDLLLTWRALLDSPAVGDRLRQRWTHVLVDEYQDVNRIQVDIVRLLRPGGVGLTVVGDDAQAVYGFRGAGSGQLTALAASCADTRVVSLERNFRSPQALLDLANAVRPRGDDAPIQLTADRPAGGRASRPRLVRCHDVADEARRVVDTVLADVEDGGRLRGHAVLMRSAHHSDLLELELAARRVPFVKYGGLKFLEAAHVKDVLAAARVLVNPSDELAWARLVRLHRGIGAAGTRAVVGRLAGDGTGTVDEAGAVDGVGISAVDVNAAVAAAPPASRLALGRTLETLVGAADAPTPAQVAACVAAVRPLITDRYPDAAARLGDVDRLAEAAARAPDLATFVAEITLDPPVSTGDLAAPPRLDEDWLTLTTVHSAKGLEWDAVHLIHAVDGAFPSDMALSTPAGLEEERRVFYVALTRARDRLSVYTPLRMPHHRAARDDRHSWAPQSRFLTEEAVATMDVEVPLRTAAPDRSIAGVPAGSAAGSVPLVRIPTLDALYE